MRVLSTTLMMGVLYFTAAASGYAQQASGETTSVKVYHVGDLVARQTVRASAVMSTVTKEEWTREHKQTIESLHNLAKLIEKIIPAETGAVAAHDDSLNIIVRHTAAGHQQIAGLLEQLREAERPVVELTLIPIMDPEGSEALGNKIEEFVSEGNVPGTDNLAPFVVEAFAEQVLDPGRTQEILKILDSHKLPKSYPLLFLKPSKIRMTNGRKTPIGSKMTPMCATVVIDDSDEEIRLRIDVANVADLDDEGFSCQTQSLTIPPGHSAVLFGPHLPDTIEQTFWLAIPKRIEPEQKMTSVSRDTAE